MLVFHIVQVTRFESIRAPILPQGGFDALRNPGQFPDHRLGTSIHP